MTRLDWLVVLGYLLACAAFGARLRARLRKANDYFLAERNLPAWAVMLSIVATETSAVTFLSVPGIAYQGDFTYLQLAFGYVVARVIVAVRLLPAYFRGEVSDRLSGSWKLDSAVRRAASHPRFS